MRKILLLIIAMTPLPGCCVLELHSPVSPWAFAKSSDKTSTTPVSDKTVRLNTADATTTSASDLR